MAEKMLDQAKWKPDFGPETIHPTGGVTAIGARMPLVAFNVNLDTSNLEIAEKIAKSFGTELGKSSVIDFSDGEFQPCFDESVRGATVFIVQSTFPPTDNLFELLLMIDAGISASRND